MAARPKEYYVYQLIDPRTGKPFYVGKGKGSRVDQHEKQARGDCDHPKSKMIREIEGEGFSIRKEIVKTFVSENAAFNYEKNLIKKIGLKNLTNISSGGRIDWFIDSSKRYDKTKTKIDAMAVLIRKTGGKPAKFKFCNHVFEIGEDFFEKIREQIKGFVELKGFEWVFREFKKHNVILNLPSKLGENFG